MNVRLILTINCLLVLLFPMKSVKAADWEKLPSLPVPNGGFVGGAHGHDIIIAGGTNWEGGRKNWLRTIYAYSPEKREWRKVKDLEEPIAYGVFLQKENQATKLPWAGFVGGFDGQKPVKSFAILDGIKTALSRPLESLPDAVALSAGGIIGDTLIIVGGTHDTGKISGLRKSAHSVNLNAATEVIKLPDYPGGPFGIAASAVIGGELFVFGGAAWKGEEEFAVNLDGAYAYAAADKTWRQLKPLPVATRGITGVALNDHLIYLAGGYTEKPDGFTANAFLYDTRKDSYTPAKALPHAAMVALIACDGFIYCLGGEDKQKSRTDACFRIAIADLVK
jgi:N-acetylneuraminic acid mutarotase